MSWRSPPFPAVRERNRFRSFGEPLRVYLRARGRREPCKDDVVGLPPIRSIKNGDARRQRKKERFRAVHVSSLQSVLRARKANGRRALAIQSGLADNQPFESLSLGCP